MNRLKKISIVEKTFFLTHFFLVFLINFLTQGNYFFLVLFTLVEYIIVLNAVRELERAIEKTNELIRQIDLLVSDFSIYTTDLAAPYKEIVTLLHFNLDDYYKTKDKFMRVQKKADYILAHSVVAFTHPILRQIIFTGQASCVKILIDIKKGLHTNARKNTSESNDPFTKLVYNFWEVIKRKSSDLINLLLLVWKTLYSLLLAVRLSSEIRHSSDALQNKINSLQKFQVELYQTIPNKVLEESQTRLAEIQELKMLIQALLNKVITPLSFDASVSHLLKFEAALASRTNLLLSNAVNADDLSGIGNHTGDFLLFAKRKVLIQELIVIYGALEANYDFLTNLKNTVSNVDNVLLQIISSIQILELKFKSINITSINNFVRVNNRYDAIFTKFHSVLELVS
jgi:hypothetical protein